jgi:hypothetical protein
MRARDWAIGAVAAVLGVAAMALDHLVGTEEEAGESGAAEPVAFFSTAAIAVVLTALVFLLVVRRVDDPDAAGSRGLLLSIVSVVTLPLLFLAVPFPFTGGAVALGLTGLAGARRGFAIAAIVIGVVVAALAIGVYVADLVA